MRKNKLKRSQNDIANTEKNINIKLVPDSRLFLGIFILSSAMISFEITITRISSLVFTYNYAFMVVSLSILGLGCGGIYAFYRWKTQSLQLPYEIYSKLAFYSSLFSIFTILFIVAVTQIPIFIEPFIYFSILFIPFFFAGVVFSLIFKSFAGESFKLYFFDLLGAATGSVLTIIIIDILGGINAIIFISILGLFSSFFFISRYYKKNFHLKNLLFPITLFFIIIIMFFVNIFFGILGEIPIRKADTKDLYLILNNPNLNAEIVESRWSAFGRSDLIKYKDINDVMALFIDGAAGTLMFKFDGNIQTANDNLEFLKMKFPETIPFFSLDEDEKDNMLIIGPGGGKEVIIGLVNGVDNIIGVEVNEDFVNIVNDYRDYNGGIYTDFENVNIVVDEGRSFLRGTEDKFDIIMMVQPFTKSSRSLEGYTLTENYLLTVDAVKDYFNHLTEEGRLIIVLHNTYEIMRFITTSLTALEDLGISNEEAMNHIYTGGKELNAVLVLKKNPFNVEEAEELFDNMLSLNLFTDYSYIPQLEQKTEYYKGENGSVLENNFFNNDLVLLSQGKLKLIDLIKEAPFNISPATDDKPFFLKSERGIPKNILIIFIIALIINIFVIVVSMIFSKNNKKIRKLLIIFLLLGAGFMMVEISFFQKLILYMGSPIISLAVLLGSLLAGMGIGSFFGNKLFPNQNRKKLAVFSIISFALTIVSFFTLSSILNNLLGVNILIKAIISSSILIPIGFVLGIPFPTSIRLAKEMGSTDLITWMYGINGTMSVFGSVTAIAISTTLGFSAALIFGAICYLIIAIIFIFDKSK